MHPLKTALSDLKLGDPQAWNGLTMFPLLSDVRSSLQYLMLADGLRGGLVTVKEVSRAGSVPDLAVENRSKLPVLILDGEELVGAKQNPRRQSHHAHPGATYRGHSRLVRGAGPLGL